MVDAAGRFSATGRVDTPQPRLLDKRSLPTLTSLSRKDSVSRGRMPQMLYEKALGIERRLGELIRLIRSGRHSTPELADQLGVSVPTISRDITALRQRGYRIRSIRLPR